MSFLSASSPFGQALRQRLARLAVRRRAPGLKTTDDWQHLSGKRIGLIKWDGIGDFVLATTFLRLLQTRFPDEDITLFCQKHVAPLAKWQFPQWTIQEVPQRTKPLKRIYGQLDLRKQFQQLKPFDIVIDLRSMRDMGDAVLASWIPARSKVALKNQYLAKGVAFAREDLIYDHLISGPLTGTEETCWDILNYRQLAERFLCPGQKAGPEPLLPELKVSKSDQESLAQTMTGRPFQHGVEPFILVCPGSLEPIKEYPPSDLAHAIRRLHQDYPLPLVIAGSQVDRRSTEPLKSALGDIKPVLDLTGHLSLESHAVLVSMATVVLAMDSATAHIAGALRRPAVIILGGGHPGVFAPWGEGPDFRWLRHPLPCYGCNWVCVFDKPVCIRDISPDFIAQNLLEIVAARVRG